MPFTDILAQDHVINHFKETIKADHLSHAYIFTGQDGVGKSLFAKEFTKTLFCKKSKNNSCNSCLNCIRIEKDNHPDIYQIEIEEKAKYIKIENIRKLQHSVRLSPIESDYKIFIIKDANRMNEEASNCLLKTLEEPTPNTIFILIANSLSSIKETIKSRCQIIRFHTIPTHIIRKQLSKKFNTETREIEWVSRFSNGSLGDAVELLESNYYEINNDIINRLTRPVMDNILFAEEIITTYLNLNDSLEEKRHTLKRVLNCILQFYRDLLIIKTFGTNCVKIKTILLNLDFEGTIGTYANYLTLENIIKTIDEMLMFTKYIDYNLNINLLIENIISRITVLQPSDRQ
ncbi:MAG: DNA polymerase III subunit delta' [Candidatus Brocadiaceae bacterium]|nr:DNA polymerase III subunit delta' [Candidatus Brocadiaceae bacterium]